MIFEPGSGPADGRPNRSTDVPPMTPGRAALVGLVHQYRSGSLDPFVTLLEVHKLMYFLQEAGEPLRLRFAQAPAGPYAENLRHVLRAIDGHLVSGYGDGGDAPGKRLSLVPGAESDASAFLESQPGTLSRFRRVSELIDGFESPFGLELLSTVHWVAARQPSATREQVVERTYAWHARKRQFSRHQLLLALDVLQTRGWLGAQAGE